MYVSIFFFLVLHRIGLSADPQFLSKVTYCAYNHSKDIVKIDTVRVYHFGFKAVAIFLLYSTKDNPIRMYFYGQSFYSMIYLIFPGPYTSIQTNRVNLYSALTIWLLSTVTVQSEGYVTDGSKVYADSLLLTILALLFCYAIINLLLIGKIILKLESEY